MCMFEFFNYCIEFLSFIRIITSSFETYTTNEHTDRIKRIGNPRGTYKK